MKDYYKILGVAPGAPTEVIKAAYRALMKIHHPDVGGDPRRAKEIEEAYRQLCAGKPAAAMSVQVAAPSGPAVAPARPGGKVYTGKYLQLSIFELQSNKVLTCPKECAFYQRQCRFKQLLSVESKCFLNLKATILDLQVRNLADFAQVVDFRHGRGVLVDQNGDFYQCHQVCMYQHPAKYKQACVELFAGTQANMRLWFQQQPPGRYVKRLAYKHRVQVEGQHGPYWDQEIYDLSLAAGGNRYLTTKK